MKRKRGHKKGKKSKKSKSIAEEETLNESNEKQTSEQSSEAPPAEREENSEHESSKMEASSTVSGNSSPPIAASASSVDPVASSSVSRVKVKLKTSKAPETTTDDTEKKKSSPPRVEPEKPVVAAVVEKKEEPVLRKPVFLNVYRKTKGIKIKSKAVDGASSSVTEKSGGGDAVAAVVKVQDVSVVEKETKTTPKEDSQVKKVEVEPESAPVSSSQNEVKKTDQDSRYNKQELDDSLTVIKKIMKMEAADPFNVPVNPEALGIPDYFDIIKTPMDFGTICSNFEKGKIYMNSEDVYKDVQYIWNNCSKYNKKGDYIVDLMKRVKKNFMKYWTSAGLYTEQSSETGQQEDGGKASTKGSQSKQKKRHGRHHKSDCMCAICVLKRRKRERQGSQEESSPVGSPSVDNSSINMGEEQDMEVDVENKTGQGSTEIVELDSPVAKRQRVSESKQEVEEEEEEEEGKEEEEETLEVESENKTEANVEDKTQSIDRVMEEAGDDPVTSSAEKLVVLASVEASKSIQNEEEEKEKRLREQKEMQELKRKEWRAKINEKFQIRNSKVLNLCEALFPSNDDRGSVWNGPHSLFKRRGSSSNRSSSSLHKAVDALMKS
ncbi:unnamed protein product [Microthlaspi erraticum]|uniref:Bromo domain-containing protein n=1 Tax=Microthlaspi erraticum TaxID=1685480 RepID=A0A6D2K652_9BRAS|nr:unnamed protein product [Microthlaspi erraticum]CAA7060052.1 unnamed protein product [Microthlaspi erraticum]